jgi:hypothetical protein
LFSILQLHEDEGYTSSTGLRQWFFVSIYKLTVEAESVRGAALELENKVTALKATIQEEMQQENCLKQNYELNHAHEEL